MDHNIVHVEQFEIRDLHMDGDGTMVGSTEVMGLPMHLTLIRVKIKDNGSGTLEQFADGGELAQDRFNNLCSLGQRGLFSTSQLEGYYGHWVWFLHPCSGD